MKTLAKIGLGLGGALVALVGVVAVRTATFKTPAAADLTGVKLAPAVRVDRSLAAQHLSQAIQIQTVSHQDAAEDQPAEWDRLHAWLQATYPKAHAAMTREVVADRTLIYTWTGTDPSLAPIILMAHQDVVPVTSGTEADWKHPPFAGEIADGAVWGRGAVDDKGSLVTLFEGAEILAAQGFKPRRTVMIVSSHDEEVRGQGARAAAALLRARGIKAEFVLDEGQAIISDNPITGGPVALIGIAEKGYATLKVTARAPGGHSSSPPKDGGGVVTLAKAVAAIGDHPFPMKFSGPGAAMLTALAPSGPLPIRMAVANAWLFSPLIVAQTAATPAGAALLHTTIAPTMLKGSPKENVLPQDATAWINYRIAPGDSSAKVMAHTKAAVGDLAVDMVWTKTPDEPSPVSSTTSLGWTTIAAVAGDLARAPVAPGLVTAGTDSRYLAPVAKDVYRFQPMTFSLADTTMIHGTNEHLSLENLEQCVQFYARLIATAAR
ncbi:M20 family peptidase [Phenylobacterium sp.]|uniref:M20 family peptidase n=1 Tax=Phenylobacterium sp. TaxID=1871053 RepID=UPI003BAD8E3D